MSGIVAGDTGEAAGVVVRILGPLIAQRGVQTLVGLLYVVLIPRLMGPEEYGCYALITSLSVWFVLLSTLGFAEVVGRYAPALPSHGLELRLLYGRLLAVRLVSGAVAAVLYVALTRCWLRELDIVALLTLGGVVLVRTLGQLMFLFGLGLDRPGFWMAGQTLRSCLTLIALVPGILLGGLRGACCALLLAEIVVLLVGCKGSRSHLPRTLVCVDLKPLRPYLGLGLTFCLSDVLLATVRPSGEVLIRMMSGSYAQVGYFGLAYEIHLVAALALPQLMLAFAPRLQHLLASLCVGEARALVERLIQWLSIGSVAIWFGALLLGREITPLVLGEDYRLVALNLLPLSLALLPAVLGSAGRLLALIGDFPSVALVGSVIRLAVLWVVGSVLVGRYGGLGASLSVLAGTSAYALFLIQRTRGVIPFSCSACALPVLLSLPFHLLVMFRSTILGNTLLYIAFILCYGGVLLATRVVTVKDLNAAAASVGLRCLHQSMSGDR